MLLQTELEGIKSKVTAEKLAKLTAEMSEYSFINEDNAALLASFVMENEGSDTVSAVMSSLDAAKEAVEAGLDNQIGDEGEPQPDSQLAAEQAAQKKVAANRYTK